MSNENKRACKTSSTFQPTLDEYEDFSDVQNGLRSAGLERAELIVAIDFTKSNEWTGIEFLLV